MLDGATTAAAIVDAEARGNLELTFARDSGGRTYLRRQFAGYPYHVCRPFSYAGDPPGMATLYLQSCAGGIYRGDRLREHIVAEAGGAAHVTTQAATIVHSMDRGSARQEVLIEAAAGSFVEVLPEPFILFPQAHFASDLRITGFVGSDQPHGLHAREEQEGTDDDESEEVDRAAQALCRGPSPILGLNRDGYCTFES